MISKAVDEVSKQEAQYTVELNKNKYLWLRSESSLTAKQSPEVKFLCYTYPTMFETCRFKEWFKQIADNTDPREDTIMIPNRAIASLKFMYWFDNVDLPQGKCELT